MMPSWPRRRAPPRVPTILPASARASTSCVSRRPAASPPPAAMSSPRTMASTMTTMARSPAAPAPSSTALSSRSLLAVRPSMTVTRTRTRSLAWTSVSSPASPWAISSLSMPTTMARGPAARKAPSAPASAWSSLIPPTMSSPPPARTAAVFTASRSTRRASIGFAFPRHLAFIRSFPASRTSRTMVRTMTPTAFRQAVWVLQLFHQSSRSPQVVNPAPLASPTAKTPSTSASAPAPPSRSHPARSASPRSMWLTRRSR